MATSSKAVLSALALAVAVGAPSTALAGEWSGNIGVFSKYILRGITVTPESDEAVLQGGFDYAHESGFYAGYWGSSLGYGQGGADNANTAFENDFYGGYAGEAGPFSYDVGLIYYHYTDLEDADTPELAASIGYGPVSLGVNYLLDDVVWGNAGDTYITLNYETALPRDFSFGATAGYYLYEDDGDFVAAGSQDGAFRHLSLTLGHPIGNTGADMSLTYIIGGEDRFEAEQGNTMVLGLTYNFDI